MYVRAQSVRRYDAHLPHRYSGRMCPNLKARTPSSCPIKSEEKRSLTATSTSPLRHITYIHTWRAYIHTYIDFKYRVHVNEGKMGFNACYMH